jgi:hypothetical protein
MNVTLRTGALALALLAGTTLAAAPALADRGHHSHWDKKSWGKKHYKHSGKHSKRYSYKRYGNKKNHGWNRGYSRYNSYSYRGPRYGYSQPYYYRSSPRFGIQIF